ncbi:MAG: [FeFe] hydrogenase H-cluster radical SAM maturase HydG [Candidatus Hydrogenedentota bacterium]
MMKSTQKATYSPTNTLTPEALAWRDKRLARIRRWETTNKYKPFIDEGTIQATLDHNKSPSKEAVYDIIAKARANATTGAMLSPDEVASLTAVTDPEIWEAIFETAYWIKKTVYGNRIVLFAPLYVSSPCVNNCLYCGFRDSNRAVTKRTLSSEELDEELRALVNAGHKRLIMVYGESPENDYTYICDTIAAAYRFKDGPGEIRRANINAAPLFVNEYRDVRSVGIGTYQVFQETYHRPTYAYVHPKGTLKAEYDWRAFALHRAQEAEIDDVAIGVLFGLYDWRFELLGLLEHAMSLEREFGVGPHTISYPRLEPAEGTPFASHSPWLVSDEDFKKIVAIIRLMCPYTGSILTAREGPDLRREVMRKGGVSQMDAGSRIAVGGYAQMNRDHQPGRQQFFLADRRSLDAFILDLCREGYLPSFCTAGYREGRTGANFMPLAKHATVNNFCIANGILTFQEYLTDYASEAVKQLGRETIIPEFLAWLDEHAPALAPKVRTNLERMEREEIRDLHF